MIAIKNYLHKSFTFKESFFFYLILFSLYLLPLMVNNVHYRDDYVRTLRGNDWDILGRKLTDLIMYTTSINFNSILNISPLNYVFIILISSFTFTYFIHKTYSAKSLFSHLSLSLLILSPFYLQNLNYQYDSFAMTLGLCFIMLAYTFGVKKSECNTKSFVFASLMVSLSAALFQPVTNIFIALIFGGYLLKLKENNSIRNIIRECGIYLSGLVLYYIWFKFINNVAQTDRSKLIAISYESIKDQVILAWDLFYTIFNTLLSSPLFILFLFTTTFFFIYIFKLMYKSNTYDKILTLFSILVLLFSLWGPFILLDEVFSEARVFVSFGCLLYVIMASSEKILEDKTIIKSLLWGLIILNCFSLNYISSNLSKEEDKFNMQLSEWISYDINSRPDLLKYDTVYINSFPKRSPDSKVVLDNIPFLQYINTPFNVWISRYVIESKGVSKIYKDINNTDDKYDWEAICSQHTAKLVVQNKFYNIYTIENDTTVSKKHLSVWFKRRDNLCDDPKNVVFRKYYIKLAY